MQYYGTMPAHRPGPVRRAITGLPEVTSHMRHASSSNASTVTPTTAATKKSETPTLDAAAYAVA